MEKRGPLVKPKTATSGLELGALTTPLGWLDPVPGLLLTDAKLLAGMFCFLSSPLSFCSCKEASCTDTVKYKNKGYGSIIKLVVQIFKKSWCYQVSIRSDDGLALNASAFESFYGGTLT